MIKIAMIIPKDLAATTESIAAEFPEHIQILAGSMEKGLNLAKRFESEGFDVVIARGGTQLLLKSEDMNIPTVPIPITVMDICNAVREAKETDRHIAILAFSNMLRAIQNFIEISGRNLRIIPVHNEKEVQEKIALVSSQGYNTVIGGGVISRYGSQYGLRTIVIKTGRNSIMRAIEEAIRIGTATREEIKRGERMRTIVENTHEGIISVDKSGYIRIINSAAEKLLHVDRKTMVGKHIDNVLPQLDLTLVLNSGIEETEIIKDIHENKIMISKLPIKIKGEVVDSVVMLQDIDRIQKMEKKIRRQIYCSGHFAKYTFQDMIGVSQEMRDVVRIGKEYAKVNSTILIEGETGTGKEIIAQSIHNSSNKANGPFVAVNCAALPENLLESELFGYAPGAFTGADSKGKQGLFEQAHGGTIFLDEISEMNPLIQGRFLRVLQERVVMRLGDDKVIPIDVRVIAATNKNLRVLIREKKFREDLFYRLNVLNIVLPVLRNRKEDIPVFIHHFIKYYSQKLNRPPITLTKRAMDHLSLYPWPGNIRELKNFVERLIVISKKRQIDLEDITDKFIMPDNGKKDLTMYPLVDQAATNRNDGKAEYPNPPGLSEKFLINRTLEENMGIIKFTAKSLGISRTTLWRKMKKYGMDVS